MHNVAIQILRFVDGRFPGWVECELVDAAGERHTIRDKVPTFTTEDLDADSKYPRPGAILCEVLDRFRDENGRELVRVSSEKPYYIESTRGLFEFTVPASLVTPSPD